MASEERYEDCAICGERYSGDFIKSYMRERETIEDDVAAANYVCKHHPVEDCEVVS